MFFKSQKVKNELYIFLDVDGVLNCKADWKIPFTINPKCVDAFKQLVCTLEKKWIVRIVLSSTWRVGISNSGNDSKQIDSLKKSLVAKGLLIHDATCLSSKTRQEEIEFYIRRNGVEHYLILDDDDSLFPNPDRINLYITDYTTGIQTHDIKCINKIRL